MGGSPSEWIVLVDQISEEFYDARIILDGSQSGGRDW